MTKMKLAAATLCAVLLIAASLVPATAQEGVVKFKNRDVATQDVAQRSETAPAYGQNWQPTCAPVAQTYQYCEPTDCVRVGGRLLGRLRMRHFTLGARIFHRDCGGICPCCGCCCCSCCCYWSCDNSDDDWDEWGAPDDVSNNIDEDYFGGGEDDGGILLAGGDVDFSTLFGNDSSNTGVAY